VTLLYSGLGIGAIYALVALSLNLTIATSGVFSFAQPQFTMLGALIAYELLAALKVSLLVTAMVCITAGGALGWLVERTAVRPVIARDAHATLITTVGAAAFIEAAARLFWGNDIYRLPAIQGVSTLFGGKLLTVSLVIIATSMTVAIALHWTTQQSAWGLRSRAAMHDPCAAGLRGIDPNRTRTAGFVLSGALGAAGGILIGIASTAHVQLGDNLVILGFVACVIGGSGSYVGCTVAGLLVGVIQQFITSELGAQYALPCLFVVILTLLLLMPNGLFAMRKQRIV
jgi:branched-chain amino acid transport system permease protein